MRDVIVWMILIPAEVILVILVHYYLEWFHNERKNKVVVNEL